MDLVLNNLQRLICHKTQQTIPNQTKPGTIVCAIIVKFLASSLKQSVCGKKKLKEQPNLGNVAARVLLSFIKLSLHEICSEFQNITFRNTVYLIFSGNYKRLS